MRWYWAAIAGAVIVAFIVLEIVAIEGFRPEPLSRHEFGNMYFESGARKNAMPTEVAGRASEAKKITESQLGTFENEIFVWVAGQLAADLESSGRLQPYDAEISIGQKSQKGLLIKVSSAKTTRIYLGMLIARARLMEIRGEQTIDRGPKDWLRNGLAYYIADSELKLLKDVLEFHFGHRNSDVEDLAVAFDRNDLRGLLIAIQLHQGKGWSFERIAKASAEEIKKELGPRVMDQSDYYWTYEGWNSVRDLLKLR